MDTVGYGDQVNKEDSFKSIVDYIDQQFEAYLQEELKIKRCLPLYHDSRIHACLYFICPTGHGCEQSFEIFIAKINIIRTFFLYFTMLIHFLQVKIHRFGMYEETGQQIEYHSYNCKSRHNFQVGASEI